MDYIAIFALIAKGLTVAQALFEAGESALPAINAIRDVVTGAQTGEVTDDQLTSAEALLDQLISDFNLEME
jgi:hypothetical protein